MSQFLLRQEVSNSGHRVIKGPVSCVEEPSNQFLSKPHSREFECVLDEGFYGLQLCVSPKARQFALR